MADTRILLVGLTVAALLADFIFVIINPAHAPDYWLTKGQGMTATSFSPSPPTMGRPIAHYRDGHFTLDGAVVRDLRSIIYDEGNYGMHGSNRWVAYVVVNPEISIGHVIEMTRSLQRLCDVTVVVDYAARPENWWVIGQRPEYYGVDPPDFYSTPSVPVLRPCDRAGVTVRAPEVLF